MSPETARWLLEGVKAFSKDPNLSEWNLLPRDYFLFILNQTLETKTFLEAREILEKIILEELTAPNIPSELEFWHQELEEAEEQKREIRKETLERVRAQIRTWQTQVKKPILPLAGPASKGISRETQPSAPKPEEPPPLEITEKLAAEDEGVAFTPLFTILQPKVAASLVKKVVLAPIVKTLQVLDKASGDELRGEAVLEWREMLHRGLNSKDIDASVLAYQEAGVPPEHPIIKKLETKRARTKVYEQNHRLLSGILKHYHEFSKITGRRQIFLPEIKTFLPRLAQAPAWVKKQGYSWQLRQGLNQLGFVFRTHERVVLGPGKTVVKFTLPDKLTRLGTIKSFVYRKTAGAILTRLGKTALGQGIKKGAAWVLTRLGLAAIPTGVTQAIALALVLKDAPKLAKWFFKKLWDNPLLAGFLGAGLLLLPLLLALPFLLIPILVVVGAILLGSAILSGAAQLGGAIISGVGSFLGGVVQTTGGILSSLSTMSLPGFLTAAGGPVVWSTVGVGVVSFVVIMNTSAAFVEKPTTAVGVPTPYGACSLNSNAPGSGALKELMINASQWAGIPPAVLAGVASIEGGHLFGYSDQQIQQFSAPGAQDPTNCASNGCGARGPMQFLNNGVATDCGQYTGQVMPDVWGAYRGAVNQAIPSEQRDPNVCNIKDSLYAAAWKIKGDSQTSAEQTCVWDEQTVNRVGLAYYGDCTTVFPRLGNKTYCQYLWDYYKTYNLVQTPSPSGWFFWQADPRWKDYSGGWPCGNVGTHGCGPTSMAMVFKAFGTEMIPPTMWDRFLESDYLICGIGSDWTAMRTIPPQAGLSSWDLGTNWDLAAQKLSEGKLVVAATNLYGGHILVVRQIEGDLVITNDPAVSNGDGKPYTRAGLLLQKFWAIGK